MVAAITARFDRRIQAANTEKQRELASVDKELFVLTHNLNLDDWRMIRKGNYWSVNDAFCSELDQKKFLLGRVKKYLKDESE